MVQIGRQRSGSRASGAAQPQVTRQLPGEYGNITRQLPGEYGNITRQPPGAYGNAPGQANEYGQTPADAYGGVPSTVPPEFLNLIPVNPPPPQRDDIITIFEAPEGKGYVNITKWVSATPTALKDPQAKTKRPRQMLMGRQRAVAQKELSMVGPAEFEGLDPSHRFGQWTSKFWNLFQQHFPERKFPEDAGLFFSWLDLHLEQRPMDPQVYHILATQVGHEEVVAATSTSKDLNGLQRFHAGVRYMHTEAKRKKYRALIKGGLVWRQISSSQTQLAPFDTAAHITCSSGRGWAIWVRDRDSNFYTHSHKAGRFHHSSFLAGAPVQGAGEWIVEAGTICVVRGKSGHYKPGIESLFDSLRVLQQCGATFGSHARVLLWKRRGLEATAVLISDFLQAGWQTMGREYLVDKDSRETAAPGVVGSAPAHPRIPNALPANPGELFDAAPAQIAVTGYEVVPPLAANGPRQAATAHVAVSGYEIVHPMDVDAVRHR